ncbi:MAG: hypothetical protein UW28_C0022G0010 [Parcubacteria group bacterium GW2011_GWA2_44_13]|nr:MAG: hypothetical protein UW28_C0022G0010 [Parcubacteria group bacterium GW2011_GWA2_44_13]
MAILSTLAGGALLTLKISAKDLWKRKKPMQVYFGRLLLADWSN